jgi:Sec-independent protein translocase protein TatA
MKRDAIATTSKRDSSPNTRGTEVNATVLIFDVIPVTLGLVGLMASLVFGPEVLRWFARQLAAQRNRAIATSSDMVRMVEREDKTVKMKKNDKSNSEREPDSELVLTR